MHRAISRKRDVVQALSYRLAILFLDFFTLYLFTGALHAAVGFMIASNVHPTLIDAIDERTWAKVQWGIGLSE